MISQLTGVDILYNEGFYVVLIKGLESLQQLLVFLLFATVDYTTVEDMELPVM